MSYFQAQTSDRPLGVVVVGAGEMGQRWLRLVHESDLADLAGVVDIDVQAARAAALSAGAVGVQIGSELSALLSQQSVDAVINVTVPEAHFDINMECLRANLPVLCEKPLVPSLSQAFLLAGAAESHSTLLMASQSRRYYRSLSDFRATTSLTGIPFLVTTQFFRDPHFGGFRERMPHPLLVDMAIHAFDAARFLTQAEPVSVQCETFNPTWSWYDGHSAAVATFQMTNGSRLVYTGSWCSGGLTTSWNGSWRLSGPHGSATWDGLGGPLLELAGGNADRLDTGHVAATDQETPEETPEEKPEETPEEIAGALHEFVAAVRSGVPPSGDVHSNLWTLAMVHAAVQSADLGGSRVQVRDLLDSAYREAMASGGDAASALEQWTSPSAGLVAGAGHGAPA